MGLTGTVTVATQVKYTPVTPPDLEIPVDSLALTVVQQITTGAGAGQSDRLWSDRRTVAASTTDNLDLSGILVDVYGATLALARVKMLFFEHVSGTNPLTIGNSGVNAFNTPFNGVDTNAITLGPNGSWSASRWDATGFVVTAGTGDILAITNGAGASVTYKVVIIGASS